MRANRWASVLTCVATIGVAMQPQASRGDVTYTENDDGLAIVRMNVTPAAEPVPALRYRLVARDIDLRPGNAAPFYYRAFLEARRPYDRILKEYGSEEVDRWYGTDSEALSLAELPLDKVRAADAKLRWVIDSYLTPATGIRDCDWQLNVEALRGVETVAFLLPEFQDGRQMARILSLRTRLALAEHRYVDAIDAMRMTYRLAVDTAKVPFLVNGLIGIAEASMANGTLIELMASPDSPNMYWALAELPNPLIDLRPAARFEFDFGPRMFPFIHHAETTDHSPAEWNRLYTQSFRDLGYLAEDGIATSGDLGASLLATAMALANYSYAKSQLVAQGMDRDDVEAMAVGQVMAIYTERNYRRFADDFQKLWFVPYWEMRDRYRAFEKRLAEAGPLAGGPDREVVPIVHALLPAMHAARTAQVRLERDLAAMQVIEALRMYAASHAGGLPARLDEITEVPVPLNPATGKPFVYRLDGTMAVLELPASDGIPGYYRRFEINVAQSGRSFSGSKSKGEH